MNSNQREIGVVLLLLAALLGFCQELVFQDGVPFYRDLTNYFYPLRNGLAESFRVGQLGLWDRHFAQGFPSFASFQTGAFYPPHWVLLILPLYESIRVLFVFHFLIAGFGSYVLLRRWDYDHDLALVGSLLFSIGGVTVSLTNLLNHFQSAVWLPWIVILWEQLLISPRWRRFITFTLIIALQFLAGSPEFTAFSILIAMISGFSLSQNESHISSHQMIGFAIAANLLMLCLIMVQVLPTAELLLESRRGNSIPVSESFMWSLEPVSLLNLFLPDNEIDRSIGVGIVYYFGRKIPLFLSLYLGLIGLYGIALWIYYGARREKIILSFLVVISLALAMGSNTEIYPFIFHYVPVLSAVRFPEKYFFVTNALLIIMTMRGLRSFLIDDTNRVTGALVIIGSISLSLLSLYLYLTFRSELLSDLIAAIHRNVVLPKGVGHLTVGVLTTLQRQVILSSGITSLLILIKTRKIRPVLFSVLFVGLVYIDLTWAHRSLLFPINPAKLLPSPAIVSSDQIRQARLFYYPTASDLHPAYFTVQGQPNFEQAVGLSYQNYLPNVGTLYGIDYFQEIDALGRRDYSDFLRVGNGLPLDRQIKLLGTFNVKYLVSFHELLENNLRLVRRSPKYFSWLYEIKSVVPRAYIVSKFTVEKQPLRALQRLSTLEFDPKREVILDSDVSFASSPSTSAQVEIERYENGAVALATKTNGESVLVLADSYYPGWRAYVDGKETAIIRANHFYKAIKLPSGQHRVEFNYEPRSFKIGMLISLLTLSAMILVTIFVSLRQRNRDSLHVASSAEVLRI